VTQSERYAYAVGAVVAPTVEVGANDFTLGAQLRFESYWAVEGLDRRQELIVNQVSIRDTRTLERLYVVFAPLEAFATRITLERRERIGEIDNVRAARTEWALASTVGVRF
jgi:hypothetical protein